MSVHQMSEQSFKVMWRSPSHSQKCKPGCVKTMHQHGKTFDNERDATAWGYKMIMIVAGAREVGHTVGVLLERPGSVRTFRALALACIADKVSRGKWSAGTGKLRKSSLGKLGKWADQSITSASIGLRGAQAIVSAVKYPDSPISLIKAAMDYEGVSWLQASQAAAR
jgi:hypothetical protein